MGFDSETILREVGRKRGANMGYYTAKYELPVCNHTEEIDKDNLGNAKGITDSGVPFEAEFATEGENLLMALIMSAINRCFECKHPRSVPAVLWLNC